MSKGWFDEQIKCRIENDQESFENVFADLSSIVLGKSVTSAALDSDRIKTKTAIEEILKYFKMKPIELPEDIEDRNDQLEYLLRPTGIMRRMVKLQGKWWHDAAGPMLGQTVNGDTVALIPKGASGYSFFDYKTGKRTKLSKKNKSYICEDAYCFYYPLPLKKLGISDLIKYMLKSLAKADIMCIVFASLFASLVGLFTPYITKLIYANVIPSNETGLLIPVAIMLIGVTVSTMLIGITKSLLTTRIHTKLSINVESAAMSRTLSLPVEFFKQYNTGELSLRVSSIHELCDDLISAFLSTGLTTLFSFVYLAQIISFAPALALPAMIIIVLQLVITVVTSLTQLNLTRYHMKATAKLNGLTFSIFSGIQKIKLTGAEKRIFAKWGQTYKQEAKFTYNPPLLIKIQPIFAGIISMLGMVILYYNAAVSGVSVANYMAFNSAYGMVSGAIMSLAGIAMTFANIRPIMEMAEPILKAQPEIGENKKIVTKLSGQIEINNITFRYNEAMPLVIDNLSLKIQSGQYIAIVGKTGCGKSTLMRLLLGFENPQKGAIYYNGQDLAKIDLRSLRQNIGAVMQNGKLFTGSILSNITVSAPWLGTKEAWEAAELAGIADDIRAMPMGMQTMISEGSGGISGGQRQRLLIARAIVSKPRILIFDEATSALDNITQKHVSDALDSLNSTRIVIAHRLSTIRHCDRIIVLEGGCIREDGNYEELIQNGGYFAELVERQRIGTECT